MKSDIISRYKALIDNKLSSELSYNNTLYQSVINAMNYSVSIGGKRIRPALLLEFARICGGDSEAALNMACALEMIHTYSLIHDDLPCMDDDDTRRGMPSCHIKFGEATALLAGDGLLTHAFLTASKTSTAKPSNINKCISILAEYAGVNGMIGGQVIDLQSEGEKVPLETLETLCELKTARLLQSACVMGCVISDADQQMIAAASDYGRYLGLAFQIVDDILDVVGDEGKLGKPIGSDATNEKSTFVSLLGLEKAKDLAHEYTNKAINALIPFGQGAEQLKLLAEDLCYRDF